MARAKKPKQKTCRICKEKYWPFNSMQIACSAKCALIHARKQREKQEKKEHKEAKERLKTKAQWTKEAQIEFNKFIRLRDHGQNCISCGRKTGCKVNAGHYRSVGSSPELRFNEHNVHLQCEHCNCFKSGNAIDYRIRLVQKIGKNKVEWLEGPHEPKKYTIEDLKKIKLEYREKSRQLKKELGL